MAKVFGTQSNYIVKNEQVSRKLSKASLLVMAGISGILSAFITDIVSRDISADKKILIFLPVTGAIFLVSWWVLKFHSRSEKRANQFLSGFQGEEAVFNELSKLPDEYYVFRDVVLGKGNIDYVVVRPNVVFCIEAKNHGGRIGFNGYELQQWGKPFREGDFILQTFRESKQLHEFLGYHMGQMIPVVSILVFSNPKAYVEVAYKPVKYGVHVMHVRMLRRFIESNRLSHGPINIPALAAFLERNCSSHQV